jgi:hypothetical protein
MDAQRLNSLLAYTTCHASPSPSPRRPSQAKSMPMFCAQRHASNLNCWCAPPVGCPAKVE